jgi:cell division protein FtsW (lipid II flippase)
MQRLRTLRNRELVNLALVAGLTMTGFTSVFLARENAVSRLSLTYAGVFLGMYLVAHIVLRVAAPYADPYLLPLVCALTAIGEVEIYRINPILARDQGIWIGLGVVVFTIVLFGLRDVRRLQELRYTCGAAAVVILAATAVAGTSINGARLWIRVGGYQIEPVEFSKIFLIIFLAGYLREAREVLERPARRLLGVGLPALRHILPLLAMWGAALVLLVFVNDYGFTLLFFGLLLAMLYVATGRWLYTSVGLLAAVGGMAAASRAAPHVAQRVSIWVDPWRDPQGHGYQIVQSLYSIADGGIFGAGFGRGFVLIGKHTVIPFAQTDFIFSVIAAETGLAGAAGVLLLYLLLVHRGMKIASLADDGFTKLLAAGLAFAIGFQAFVIVAGVTKLLPLTGVTLPFVSYGGSSVVANFALIALLCSVSNRANRDQTVAP